MHSGLPVLPVSAEGILTHSTTESLADVAKQARLAEELASYLEPTPESATVGDCAPVYGKLLTFDDPKFCLP